MLAKIKKYQFRNIIVLTNKSSQDNKNLNYKFIYNQKGIFKDQSNKCFPFSTSKIRSPLDLSFFKDQSKKQILKKSLQARYKQNPQQMITSMQSKLQKHKSMLYDLQMSNKRINQVNKEMKNFMKQSKAQKLSQNIISQRSDKIKEKMKQAKIQQNIKSKAVQQIVNQIQKQLKNFGNIINQSIKISKNQEENRVIKQFYPQNYVNSNKKLTYHQIFQKLDMLDLKRGQKVSGHRGYFLKSNSVRLSLALAQFGLDFLQQKGYNIYQSPTLIQRNVLQQSCQLNTIQNDMYKVDNQQNLYLIATSQQSLAGFYRGQVLNQNQFPIKMGGYSSCYRKQAGAHGKDIQGIFRVHQFQKVQQFLICSQAKSQQMLQSMISVSEQFYQKLKIPYRLVQIVSGQLNDAAIKKIDLQGWYPKQNKYRQLVSISNCTDYQSRMLQVQYFNKKNEYCYPHMLNGTLIAIQRAMTCFMENWQNQQGIQIPEILHNYLSKRDKSSWKF